MLTKLILSDSELIRVEIKHAWSMGTLLSMRRFRLVSPLYTLIYSQIQLQLTIQVGLL